MFFGLELVIGVGLAGGAYQFGRNVVRACSSSSPQPVVNVAPVIDLAKQVLNGVQPVQNADLPRNWEIVNKAKEEVINGARWSQLQHNVRRAIEEKSQLPAINHGNPLYNIGLGVLVTIGLGSIYKIKNAYNTDWELYDSTLVDEAKENGLQSLHIESQRLEVPLASSIADRIGSYFDKFQNGLQALHKEGQRLEVPLAPSITDGIGSYFYKFQNGLQGLYKEGQRLEVPLAPSIADGIGSYFYKFQNGLQAAYNKILSRFNQQEEANRAMESLNELDGSLLNKKVKSYNLGEFSVDGYPMGRPVQQAVVNSAAEEYYRTRSFQTAGLQAKQSVIDAMAAESLSKELYDNSIASVDKYVQDAVRKAGELETRVVLIEELPSLSTPSRLTSAFNKFNQTAAQIFNSSSAAAAKLYGAHLSMREAVRNNPKTAAAAALSLAAYAAYRAKGSKQSAVEAKPVEQVQPTTGATPFVADKEEQHIANKLEQGLQMCPGI